MNQNKIQQIPIVDEKKKILGVHFWDEINTANLRSNLMIIMAGGQGTRLRPATNDLPKPMLQVAGKPILEHIIEKARSDGFRNFVISIYYLGTVIEEYFRDGSKFGVKIQYLKVIKLTLMNLMNLKYYYQVIITFRINFVRLYFLLFFVKLFQLLNINIILSI